MLAFGTQFLICNIFICLFIGVIVAVKLAFKNHLSGRLQYHLWFLLFALLAVPFLPIRPINFLQLASYLNISGRAFTEHGNAALPVQAYMGQDSALDKMNDFAVSVGSNVPSLLNIVFLSLWCFGMFIMILLLFRSWHKLHQLEKSALPLQNAKVHHVFEECLCEMNIKKEFPIYSTPFLKSPVTVGFIKPCIYLPLHLVSDFNQKELRYMLLHELQHYRHRDALIGHLINLTGVLYWFNPLVWYALKEMRCDREIACDTSVLQMLHKKDYIDYGNTLINFAEKISLTPFPFTTGMGGSMKQMKRRILCIAKFRRTSFHEKVKGIIIYTLAAFVILALSPILSTKAADPRHYQFQEHGKSIAYLDLSTEFKGHGGGAVGYDGSVTGYRGSFVLYDEHNDSWEIYNKEAALSRIAPDSTFKIYDALLGLESGIITPDNSSMAWNGDDYPFDTWKSDQDLNSALHNSVNWYFQSIDGIAGGKRVKTFLKKIGYGNQTVGNDLNYYWADSSLRISPMEQVELLKKFYHNEFHFPMEDINTVKKAIRISSTSDGTLSGKTGTGRVNGRDNNAWFIGYVEKSGHVYYFATNLQGTANTTGSEASKITESILAKLHIWG